MTSAPSARNSSARKISSALLKPRMTVGLLALRDQLLAQRVERGNADAAAQQQGLVAALVGVVAVAQTCQNAHG